MLQPLVNYIPIFTYMNGSDSLQAGKKRMNECLDSIVKH